MKIFAAGVATETNTFCPIPTTLDDFIVQRGRDVLAGRIDYPSLDLRATWGIQAQTRGAEFDFSLMAWAQPSGTTTRDAYESLRDEMLHDLHAAMPVDVVLLNLHGAMVAHGYEDCEEDMIRRVRNIVGPKAVIGVELDLHCHLRASKIAAADIVVIYKEYPHTDVSERGTELFELAVRTKLGEIRPTMALFECHMAGMYPTTRQPMRDFVDSMSEAERGDGVLSLSLGHGFHFGDVPHMGAKMLAVSDGNPDLATRMAEEFGRKAYRLRGDIAVDSLSLPMQEALAKALASTRWPVIVADQSDNPGSGAPGDSTFALRWLIDHRASNVGLAILYDPETVRIAKKSGVGATLQLRVGGKLGPSSGDPVDIEATVMSARDNYMHAFPQQTGDPQLYPTGDTVALRCGDGIDIVVGSERCQCFSPSIFTDLGIDPKKKQVVIAKSIQHFYGAFAPIAGEIIYMQAPGASAPDPRLTSSYRRVDTGRLYPWCHDPLA